MLRSELSSLRPGQRVYVLGRRNRDGTPVVAKVNGRPRREGGVLVVPLKRGLYDFGYLTERNCGRFSLRPQPWGVRHNPCGRGGSYPDYKRGGK